MTALLVCQAGEGVGLGHLSRALVVASALRQQLAEPVRLLIQGEPVQRPDVAALAPVFVPAAAPLGPAIAAQIQQCRPWVLLLDLHAQRLPQDLALLLQQARASGCRVVAIDGLLAFREQLDLVFLPTWHCDDPRATGAGAPVVFGMDCLLVADGARAQAWQPGPEVLVLTGGADTTGLGAVWPAWLDAQLPARARPHWVQGPYARAPRWPQPRRLDWTWHRAPAGLQAPMASAHYALTIFGVSFFELLKLGVPTVVCSPYGGKDLPDLRWIEATNLAWVAYDEKEAVRHLCRLMDDDESAAALSERGLAAMALSGGAHLCRLLAAWQAPPASDQ